ncbi:MAG: porin [Gemmatimonadales bacterium]
MFRTRAAGAALFALSLLGLASAASAQTTFPAVKVTGSLQSQGYWYNHSTFAAAGDSGISDIFIRRARIEVEGEINEYVKIKIQPSFEGGREMSQQPTITCTAVPAGGGTPTCTSSGGRSGFRLRDAYVEVNAAKPSAKDQLSFRLGQEKRPFNRYDLSSSRNLPSIERGAGQGLPGAASFDLLNNNGIIEHDVGASLNYRRTIGDNRFVNLKGTVTNGEGESVARDKNQRKSFGFRGTADVYQKLGIGASFYSHDNANLVAGKDSSYNNTAFGLDAQWGKPGDPGLYVVTDFFSGKDRTKAANKMRGLQVVGAYNIRMTSPTSWLYAIEPAVRFDVADPNTKLSGSEVTTQAQARVTTITAVLGFYMSSKAQFRVAYERQTSELKGTPTVGGIRTALTVNF